jgi:hypothetical protein
MRTFAQKPNPIWPTSPAHSTTLSRAPIRQTWDSNSILNGQRTIGNQAVQRLIQENRGKVRESSLGTEPTRFDHDFSRIPVHAPPTGAKQPNPALRAAEQPPVTAEATSTRNADGSVSPDEVVTSNGTPAPAPGVAPSSPSPPLGPPFAAGQCSVDSGPTYTPSGNIPVTNTGARKTAPFSMAATFGAAIVTLPPQRPSCCEVRQYIKWDNAFHTWNGGPPHSGFPSSAAVDTWYEDRDRSDKRYGHRSGAHSDPIAGCVDEYLTGGARDQANGNTYCGHDAPGGPAAMTGSFQFQLKVIDTCNGNAEKASSSIITINWGGTPTPAPAPGVTPPSPRPPTGP